MVWKCYGTALIRSILFKSLSGFFCPEVIAIWVGRHWVRSGVEDLSGVRSTPGKKNLTNSTNASVKGERPGRLETWPPKVRKGNFGGERADEASMGPA